MVPVLLTHLGRGPWIRRAQRRLPRERCPLLVSLRFEIFYKYDQEQSAARRLADVQDPEKKNPKRLRLETPSLAQDCQACFALIRLLTHRLGCSKLSEFAQGKGSGKGRRSRGRSPIMQAPVLHCLLKGAKTVPHHEATSSARRGSALLGPFAALSRPAPPAPAAHQAIW